MLRLREERPPDADAIRQLLVAAFGGEAEARLVERLRASGGVGVSLVAQDDGRILGYLAFSAVVISTASGDVSAQALAPLAVVPAFQRLGIGSALVSAGLERLREAGHPRVVVLGDPRYYSRFGFTPAARFGLRCPFPTPADAFMVLELEADAFQGCAGVVRYGHEFEDLD